MPDANLADNSVLTSAFWNTYAREQVVSIVTTATRPSNVEGRHISDTDTGRLHRGDGTSAWDPVDVTPWTSYTPSWAAGVTVGNGTYSGCQFRYVGNSIEVRGQFTLGSTSALSALPQLTVPDSVTLSSTSLRVPIGGVVMSEGGGSIYSGNVLLVSSTAVGLYRINVVSSSLVYASPSATAPFTWGADDVLAWNFLAPLA